jgi:hypothetical protein
MAEVSIFTFHLVLDRSTLHAGRALATQLAMLAMAAEKKEEAMEVESRPGGAG